MNNKSFKGVLFDLDGVVFDTEPQYSIFWGNQFKEYYPGSSNMEKLIKGQTLIEIYDKYFPKEEIQKEITLKLDDFEKRMKLDYVEGFEKLATSLRKEGIKTAVVTSSNKAKMSNVYAKRPEFQGYFDAILTAEDFSESKPSPDCYQKAAARFGLTADECIVFEDSFNGLKSGKAAKMFVVGLSTTNPEDAIRPYSDIVIKNYIGITPETLRNEINK